MIEKLTFDGQGYGKSDYWHQVAYRTAKEMGEDCSCWHEQPFILTFGEKDFCMKIRCSIKKPTCVKYFTKTEYQIQNLFKEFYK